MLKLQIQWETRSKLWAEGNKLWAEGNIQWFAAIIETYGNVVISWKGNNCIVEGDEYKATN